MSVKNVTAADLALLELLKDGETAAPSPLLDQLQAAGYLTLSGGVPSLNAAGRKRAEALKPHEHDLRKMHSARSGGGSKFTADGGPSLRT